MHVWRYALSKCAPHRWHYKFSAFRIRNKIHHDLSIYLSTVLPQGTIYLIFSFHPFYLVFIHPCMKWTHRAVKLKVIHIYKHTDTAHVSNKFCESASIRCLHTTVRSVREHSRRLSLSRWIYTVFDMCCVSFDCVCVWLTLCVVGCSEWTIVQLALRHGRPFNKHHASLLLWNNYVVA